MTQAIYRPSAAGGELQLKVGSGWIPIYGVQGITVSGGDRETSDFETLDGGVESTFGQAGVKDISLTLNPSFMGAQFRKIVDEAYYGEDTVTIRYRTLANKTEIAKGGTGDGISITSIDAGLGNEGDVTFEKTTANSGGKAAQDAIKATAELGIIATGSDTAVGGSDRTEEEPSDAKFFIVRYDGSKYKASEWDGNALSTAIATKDGWMLIRYGIAFEYTCRVVTAMNPELAVNAAVAETFNLRQVSSGFKVYPILKAAS